MYLERLKHRDGRAAGFTFAVTAVSAQCHNKSLTSDAAAKPHGCCRSAQPRLLKKSSTKCVIVCVWVEGGGMCPCVCFGAYTLMHVHACCLCTRVKPIGRAACLESFKQSENTFLHVESFLPIGVSLFPKTALLSP